MSLSRLAFLVAFILFLLTGLVDNFANGKGIIWGLAATSFGLLVAGYGRLDRSINL